MMGRMSAVLLLYIRTMRSRCPSCRRIDRIPVYITVANHAVTGPSGPVKLAKPEAGAKPAAAKKTTTKKEESPAAAKKTTKATTKKAPAAKKAAPKTTKAKTAKATKATTTKKAPAAKANTSKKAAPKKTAAPKAVSIVNHLVKPSRPTDKLLGPCR